MINAFIGITSPKLIITICIMRAHGSSLSHRIAKKLFFTPFTKNMFVLPKNIQTFLFLMTFTLPTFFSSYVSAQSASPLNTERLKHIIKHDCGSCHGMTLKGGLGPSILEEDLKKWSDEQLFTVIKWGRPKLVMPPWKDIFTDQEIQWIIKYLRGNTK